MKRTFGHQSSGQMKIAAFLPGIKKKMGILQPENSERIFFLSNEFVKNDITTKMVQNFKMVVKEIHAYAENNDHN